MLIYLNDDLVKMWGLQNIIVLDKIWLAFALNVFGFSIFSRNIENPP